MPFATFCRLLHLAMCASLLGTYVVSQSIRRAMVATLGIWLLLQVAYFASVLFLVWRSSCAPKVGQRAERFGNFQKVPCQPQEHCRDED